MSARTWGASRFTFLKPPGDVVLLLGHARVVLVAVAVWTQQDNANSNPTKVYVRNIIATFTRRYEGQGM